MRNLGEAGTGSSLDLPIFFWGGVGKTKATLKYMVF